MEELRLKGLSKIDCEIIILCMRFYIFLPKSLNFLSLLPSDHIEPFLHSKV